MFTGIIMGTGEVTGKETRGEGIALELSLHGLEKIPEKGGSIAVNGACLTAEAIDGDEIEVFLSLETVEKTTLGDLEINDVVNIETPLRADEGLDGHIVQGHVDTTTTISDIESHDEGKTFWINTPVSGSGYIASKGSVAIDGISLTVAGIEDGRFSVAVIPETLRKTNLSLKKRGDMVNVEFDVIAKYVERQIEGYI